MKQMRKFYLGWTVLAMTVAVVLLVGDATAYPKKVLVEDFTNTSCGPCYTWTPYVLRALEDFEWGEEYVLVAYHAWWPGANDPWWQQNQDENRQKVQRYGVNGVPAFFIDGVVAQLGESLEPTTRNRLNAHLAEETPIAIRLVPRITEDGGLRTRVFVTSDEEIDDLDLHIFVGERVVAYQAPNRQNEHHGPMLDMIGENGGDGTNFDISANETLEFEFESGFEFNLGGRVPEEDNVFVAAWVQDSDLNVIQTETSPFEITTPLFSITGVDIRDEDGNGDGRAEAGESVDVVIAVENDADFLSAEDIEIVMSTDMEGINITNDTYSFDELENGQSADNEDAPFSFTVSDEMDVRSVQFTFTVSSQPGNYIEELPVTLVIGWPDVLVVDASAEDDAAVPFDMSFDTDQLPYVDMWNRVDNGEFSADAVDSHISTIIWHSHNAEENLMSDEEEAVITSFLDNNGILVLSGSYLAETMEDRPLFTDYLGVGVEDNSVSRVTYVMGEEGDPFFDGMRAYLGRGVAGSSSRKPSLTLMEDCTPIVRYEVNTDKIGAVRRETEDFSVMFFAFSMNTIAGGYDTETFSEFMTRILAWKDDRLLSAPADNEVAPNSFELEAAFPNPFNSSVVIPFKLAQSGHVTLKLHDLQGREVATIVESAMAAGSHTSTLNATEFGLSSGVYYLRLHSADLSHTQKLVYIR